MAVINTVREARKAAGFTQINLAKHAGIERKRLKYIECGECECTLEEALMIAFALGLDVKDVFGRDSASDDWIGGRGRGAVNLIGETFGELRVVSRMPGTHSHRGEAFWLCECSCKGMVVVRSDHLRSGHTKSCGCRAHPNLVENNTVRI